MTRSVALLPALITTLLLVPGAGAKAPAGEAFYTPPSPIPGKAHGDVIWWRPDAPGDNMHLSGAGMSMLVLYRSTGIDGTPVAESGSMAIPRGRPPKGGWPVLAWAHGSTGLADKCAPTRMPRQTGIYSTNLRAQLSAYLKAGYAVVAPDYEGLGTAGVHPYLVGVSEGRSVLDMARAARKLRGANEISRKVGIIGHSQGGHAALWASSLAPRYTPELKVGGTVAYAPASHVKEQSSLLDVLKNPSPLSALIASIFRGADVAYPSLHVSDLLSDPAAALFPSVDEKCLEEMYGPESWGGIAPVDILRSGVDRKPLLDAADKSDPENLRYKTPVLIVQGTSDSTVLPLFTDQLANELHASGAKVTYKKIAGADHSGIAQAGRKVARAYLKKRLGR
jgi:pimeloyl-ACP methyl ester carboxylesterase